MRTYDPHEIEERWQKYWNDKGLFTVTEDPKKKEKKYYILEMFPYPSGKLHMGHVRNYTIADVIARHRRMQGYYVMHPIGWDSFGLPAENAAVKYKKDPEDWTMSNIEAMRGQLRRMGFSYDWAREVTTCKDDYYRWNQWLFLKFYEKGLVYRKRATVNWCPDCETVLANEQVEEGKCWRCESLVAQKELEQWFFKITDYKEALLKDHELIREGWAERIITMQKNWIGESKGSIIRFSVEGADDTIDVFTTRADTLLGVTYIVLAPEHELSKKLVKGAARKKEINEFIEKVSIQSTLDRQTQDKVGIYTGANAVHPITGETVPIWIGNYVLLEYGTGAVMAVPAHDQRDYEFAQKYNLSIKTVIAPKDRSVKAPEGKAFEDYGALINSGRFDGCDTETAKKNITEYLISKKRGSFKKHYRFKDWLISRQRYWGTPIPFVYCDKCGMQAVNENDLPVKLPKNIEFRGMGDSPLKYAEEFVNTKCPVCGGKARRETDTMDTFVDSSWYFLRYCDPKNTKLPFSKEAVDYWMPVDQYVGGPEHACMHLLYARFFNKVLIDMGMLKAQAGEPFTRLLNQGMVIKDGAKMSKSKGNIVDPNDMLDKYGTDALRLFTLFASPPTKDLEWSEDGIEGARRFLNRLWRLADDLISMPVSKGSEEFIKDVEIEMNITIKSITDDMNSFSYNTAIARVMEAVNYLYRQKDKNDIDVKVCIDYVLAIVVMLYPITPHISEELWRINNKGGLFNEAWPVFDENKTMKTEVTFIVQVNGKLRTKLNVKRDMPQNDLEKIILENEKVKSFIEGKNIVKKIFVPNKLINIVV
ncbi:MAG: leucine--tRNA ligase [Elusimicrobiota bacterium]